MCPVNSILHYTETTQGKFYLVLILERYNRRLFFALNMTAYKKVLTKITTLYVNGGNHSIRQLATHDVQSEQDSRAILHFGSSMLPYLMSLLRHACVLELVLEEEQIVCGRHRDNIFCGVPRCMQNLFIEVKAVHTDLILLAFPPCTHLHKILAKQKFLKEV